MLIDNLISICFLKQRLTKNVLSIQNGVSDYINTVDFPQRFNSKVNTIKIIANSQIDEECS